MKTSAISTLKSAALDTVKFIGPLTKSSWPSLLAIFLGILFVNQYFHHLASIEFELTGEQGIAPKLGMMLVSLMETLFLSLLVPIRVEDHLMQRVPTPFWRFAQTHAVALTIESLRVMAQVMLWGLLFLIPGIFKQTRYFFVPFVVILDSRYQNGELDALEHSNRLVKGITGYLLAFMLGLFVIDLGIDSLTYSAPLKEQPVQAILFSLLSFLLTLLSYLFFYDIYRQREIQLTQADSSGSKPGDN